MIVIEGMLVLGMPFIVKYVTGFAKQLAGLPMAEYRVAIIRGIVAILSLVGALLTQVIGEGQLDPTMVETTVYTVINAGFATWMYLAQKNKKA